MRNSADYPQQSTPARHQTVLAPPTASETGIPPKNWRQMVVTPGGTTPPPAAMQKKIRPQSSRRGRGRRDRGREMAKDFSA